MKFPISGIILDQADTKFLFNEVKEKTILSLLKQKVVALSSLFCHRKIEKNIHDTVKKKLTRVELFFGSHAAQLLLSPLGEQLKYFSGLTTQTLSLSLTLSPAFSRGLFHSHSYIRPPKKSKAPPTEAGFKVW